MNTTEEPKRYAIAVDGLQGIELLGDSIVEVGSAQNKEATFVVRADPASGKTGANAIHFDIKALNHDGIAVREKASFLLP